MTSKRWQGGPSDRTHRIEVRLTAAEKVACERQAKEVSMTLSDWVRHRLLLDRVNISESVKQTVPISV